MKKPKPVSRLSATGLTGFFCKGLTGIKRPGRKPELSSISCRRILPRVSSWGGTWLGKRLFTFTFTNQAYRYLCKAVLGNRTVTQPVRKLLAFNESWRFITVNWFMIATCLDYKVPNKDDPSPDPTIPTHYEPFWTTVNNNAPLHHSVRQISSVHTLTFYQFQCPSSSSLNLLSPPPGLQVFRCLYGYFVSPCALHAPLILYLIF